MPYGYRLSVTDAIVVLTTKGKVSQVSQGYYTISTERGCNIIDRNHNKITTVIRRGFRNDKLAVSCSCGGSFIALTYARKV